MMNSWDMFKLLIAKIIENIYSIKTNIIQVLNKYSFILILIRVNEIFSDKTAAFFCIL